MRRKLLGCASIGVALVIGLVVVRLANRHRAEVLAELPGVGSFLTTGKGPFSHEDRLLVATGPELQLVDPQLNPVASFPTSADVDRVSASRDLSIVVALEYRRFSVIETLTGAQKWHPLEKMCTEAFVSPDGTRLWIGEYDTGLMHLYKISGVEARRVRTVNVNSDAGRVIGPQKLEGPLTFAVVATAADGLTTYLFTDRYDAVLIYDWSAGRAVGSIPLPYLHSLPRLVQSPKGDSLAIVSNRLVFIDLKANAVVTDRELDDYSRAGDFNPAGDRFFVAYSAPDMLPIPFTHRGGQVDEFDLSGNRLKTWHTKANRIGAFGARGAVTWMVANKGLLQTIRLP